MVGGVSVTQGQVVCRKSVKVDKSRQVEQDKEKKKQTNKFYYGSRNMSLIKKRLCHTKKC